MTTKLDEIYVCKHCGNVMEMLSTGGAVPECCGEKMTLQIENTTDGAHEKHIPIVTVQGNQATVTVGSVPHPMEEQHFIMWVEIQQADKTQRAIFRPGQEPRAVFTIEEGVPVSAREYCNLHGLWKG